MDIVEILFCQAKELFTLLLKVVLPAQKTSLLVGIKMLYPNQLAG